MAKVSGGHQAGFVAEDHKLGSVAGMELALGWIMLHRRLARDYEALPDNSASMIQLAMIDNLTKRVTNETTPTWRDI